MDGLSQYLQLGRQSRKLFFMDSRYPMLHLTISWGNASGEIDIHMTRELPGGTKIYGSIFRFAGASVAGLLTSFLPRFEVEATSLIRSFMREMRPVRPGWLGRKGYLIFWLPEEEHESWIMKFAHRRGKGRYRIYQASVARLNDAEEAMTHLYEPAILHEIAAHNQRGWIQALRVKGRKRRGRRVISLVSVTWTDGRVRWFPIDKLATAAMERMREAEDSIITPFKKTLSESLDRVFDDLRLSELGIERDKFISI
jgi:hypothetical protein